MSNELEEVLSAAGFEQPQQEIVTPDEPSAEDNPIAIEQPKSDAPSVAEDPKPTAGTDTDFRLADLGYDNIDSLKAELARVNDLKQENDTLSQSFNSLKEKSASVSYPKLNPDFYRLQKISETKTEGEYDFYKNLVLGNNNPIDLLKADLMKKYPDVFSNEELALSKVARKYPALFGEYGEDDKEYQDALIDLKLEANEVKKTYLSEFEKIEVPNFDSASKEAEESQTKLIESWKPVFKDLSSKINTLTVGIKNGDKAENLSAMEIPQSELKPLVEQAANFVLSNKMEVTDKTKDDVIKYANALYIVNNLEKYNTHIYNKAKEASDNVWKSKVHNPNKIDANTAGEVNTDDNSIANQVLRDLMQ